MLSTPAWLQEDEETPLQRLARLPLAGLAALYGAAAWAHRAWYERGPGHPLRLPCKVVSVGSLVVGGSGKTPTAAWLAAALRGRGHRVALASRGYGRRGRAAVEVVSDGRFVRGRAETSGDEPMLLAAHAPGVPVLVGARRDTLAYRAVAAFGTQVLVLDDGFQHHRVHRDVDLLVFAADFGLGNRCVLPRGPLREPLSALRRAHAIGLVDGSLPAAQEAWLAARAPRARRFSVIRRPARLRPLAGGAEVPLETLRGRSVGMFCGIARPRSFRQVLLQLGATLVAERLFPDHHVFRPRDVRDLASQAGLWITTEKDAGKLLPSWLGGTAMQVLGLETQVRDPEPLLDWLEGRLSLGGSAGREAPRSAAPDRDAR